MSGQSPCRTIVLCNVNVCICVSQCYSVVQRCSCAVQQASKSAQGPSAAHLASMLRTTLLLMAKTWVGRAQHISLLTK